MSRKFFRAGGLHGISPRHRPVMQPRAALAPADYSNEEKRGHHRSRFRYRHQFIAREAGPASNGLIVTFPAPPTVRPNPAPVMLPASFYDANAPPGRAFYRAARP